jgi:hypothetical protein
MISEFRLASFLLRIGLKYPKVVFVSLAVPYAILGLIVVSSKAGVGTDGMLWMLYLSGAAVVLFLIGGRVRRSRARSHDPAEPPPFHRQLVTRRQPYRRHRSRGVVAPPGRAARAQASPVDPH